MLTAEQQRLDDTRLEKFAWKKWGPYLSERQWGTVREDYSEGGDAWNYFTHDHARSRAYRWGEDGIAGISDDKQRLCFALALWNGKDPLLVIAIALPFAIVDTFETGRVYVFSRNCRGGSLGLDAYASYCNRWSPSSWGFAEALPTSRREIRPTCSGCSSVLDVVESCCEAAWRPSATWSPWGSSWTSYFN
jgi:hypothetical protein